IESGTAPANVVVATVANAQVTTQAIEEIVLNLGNAGDKVILSGDLSGTGVATHTITINGGTGDDTVDLSQLASNEDVVFSGGGHGANGDTAILGFAFGAATYQGIFDTSGDLIGVNITHNSADGPVTDTFTNLQNFNFTDGSRSLTELIPTLTVTAQFDPTNDVLNLNSQTIATSTANETVELTDAGHPGATLNASGDQFTASGINETLDLSGWDRAVEIDFAAGTIRLDANSLTQSGSISGFANVVGTTHNDSFDNLTGSVTVTGGAGAVDHFGLAANVLSSSSIPTITNYSSSSGETIDLSALLDAKFGPGSDPTKAANFVEVKEDAGGNSATLEINVSGASGGTFVAAAHLGGVHSGDVITAILDHAHTTAQLHAA
ncbi:MAG: type I secretion C-terminal target domain-containing protein, partial [Bradyrhizobium sp.]